MKKNAYKPLLAIMSVVVLVAVGISYATGFDLLSVLGLTTTGAGTLAFASLIGETTTTETMRNAEGAEDLILDAVDSDIADIAPYLAPLDTILRKAKTSKQVNSWITRFYEADTLPVEDTVTSQDQAGSNKVRNIVVGNIDLWRTGDMVCIPSLTGANASEPLMCRVSVVDRTTDKLGLFATNTTDNVCPAISGSTVIYNFGSAWDEVSNNPEAYGQVPEDEYNHMQKFMIKVEQSNLSQIQMKEVDWTLQNVQEKALFDLRRKMEYSFINSCRTSFVDPILKRTVYTTGGVLRFIDNIIEYEADDEFNDEMFNSWARQIFDGNNGSQTRYMFAGSEFMEKLGTIPSVQKQIDSGSTTNVKLGVTFSRIETVFGVLEIMHHQGLREIGLTKNAIVLDLNNIHRRVFKPMAWEDLDGVKSSGGGDVTAKVLTEVSCLVVKNKASHAYIKFKA